MADPVDGSGPAAREDAGPDPAPPGDRRDAGVADGAVGDRAAVDVGTNSVRLLVLDGQGRPLDRRMTITRLGRGVDEHGRLDDEALQRTLAVLRGFRKAWEAWGVAPRRVRIAATSAVRDAADRERFFRGVEQVTGGVPAEVVTGEEEAAFAFRGATQALELPRPAVVVDIGGGSTEVVVGDGDGAPAAAVSLQLGSVRLTERLLASDPPRPEQVAAARREVAARLEEGDRHLDARGVAVADAAVLVGVAGTVTTVAALHLGLSTYEPDRVHGTVLPRPALETWTDRLLGMRTAERAELGPVAAGRADVIAAGALIALGVLAHHRRDRMVVSEADNLDGLAASVA